MTQTRNTAKNRGKNYLSRLLKIVLPRQAYRQKKMWKRKSITIKYAEAKDARNQQQKKTFPKNKNKIPFIGNNVKNNQ